MRLKKIIFVFLRVMVLGISVFFIGCRKPQNKLSMVAIDTITWETRQYDSAPPLDEFREIFLSSEDNYILWGSLRRIDSARKGTGDIITRYDLTNGNILDTIKLSQDAPGTINILGMGPAFFPKTLEFVYTHIRYENGEDTRTQIGSPDIIKYNIKTNQSEVICSLEKDTLAELAYLDENHVLISKAYDFATYGENKMSELLILNIHTKERRSISLPSMESYFIADVSGSNRYVVLTSLLGEEMLLVDLIENNVRQYETTDCTLAPTDVEISPNEKQIAYTDGRNIFTRRIAPDASPELLITVNEVDSLRSIHFLNDSTLIYTKTKRKSKQKNIVVYNLETKITEKELTPRSIFSDLFVIGKYIVYME